MNPLSTEIAGAAQFGFLGGVGGGGGEPPPPGGGGGFAVTVIGDVTGGGGGGFAVTVIGDVTGGGGGGDLVPVGVPPAIIPTSSGVSGSIPLSGVLVSIATSTIATTHCGPLTSTETICNKAGQIESTPRK